ncbi:acetate uptake transporter [Asanoa sp. WMMD1127]|uniref:acetate uptake transporter n=1 Tax=Asanoa sp. WMMD1127 TaxID=3016107 RepID=UPI002417113B|nr:acetate uptake transporter [Asanoa sp. WMMD1127]MDG4820482.1 acetate uptake transporter [Asanoa sp. WMMD1127]
MTDQTPNRPMGGRPGDPRMPSPEPASAASGVLGGVADATPMGLAAFALSTFLLSAFNAGWTNGTTAWLSFGFVAGGLVQLLAGMWAFRNRNLFNTVAFSMYGAFFLGLALYFTLVAPGASAAAQRNDLAWILLAFALFNFYLVLWATQVNETLFGVFFFLGVTEVLLCIGFFVDNGQVVRIGGYLGVLTALVAWYGSSGALINGLLGREAIRLGAPLKLRGLEQRLTHRPAAR